MCRLPAEACSSACAAASFRNESSKRCDFPSHVTRIRRLSKAGVNFLLTENRGSKCGRQNAKGFEKTRKSLILRDLSCSKNREAVSNAADKGNLSLPKKLYTKCVAWPHRPLAFREKFSRFSASSLSRAFRESLRRRSRPLAWWFENALHWRSPFPDAPGRGGERLFWRSLPTPSERC